MLIQSWININNVFSNHSNQ